MVLIASWSGLRPPKLTPWSRGPDGVLEPQLCILVETLLNKICWAPPNLVRLGCLIAPQIRIWKNLGPVSFWSHGVYKIKVVLNVPNSAWQQGQGIGLEGLTGPWQRWVTQASFQKIEHWESLFCLIFA